MKINFNYNFGYRNIHQDRKIHQNFLTYIYQKKPQDNIETVFTGRKEENSRALYFVDYDGNLQRFESASKASKSTDVRTSQINMCLDKRSKTAKGFQFVNAFEIEFADGKINTDALKLLMENFRDAYNQPVYKINYDGTLERYDSTIEASKENDIQNTTIYAQIKQDVILPTAFIFVKAFDIEKRDENFHTILDENGKREIDYDIVNEKISKFQNSASVPIYVFNRKDMRLMGRYSSSMELSKKLNVPISNIYSQLEDSSHKGRENIYIKAFDIEKRDEFGCLIKDKDGNYIIDENKLAQIISKHEDKYNTSSICAVAKSGIKKFRNIKEASDKLSISRENIRKCLNGEYRKFDGYVFMLASELELRDKNNAPILDNKGNILLNQENYDKALRILDAA